MSWKLTYLRLLRVNCLRCFLLARLPLSVLGNKPLHLLLDQEPKISLDEMGGYRHLKPAMTTHQKSL